ncbi:MAG: hypothetical protein JJU33_10870 [Phycisphaerales bacterium]|nr:hypothetical protein [Phycisphaerales bacterium]
MTRSSEPIPADSRPPRTRLAPSPTGALHLGNALTFLLNWAAARAGGWTILLRIEDLDTPRVKPGAIDETIDILRWLGLDYDEGPIVQSDDLEPYREAMRTLANRGQVYPCELSRGEIEAAASAPQEGVHETRFPASLRPADRPSAFEREDVNWRLAVHEGAVAFTDLAQGPQSIDPSQSVGDFVVWTKRAQPSYQLAVVVDDASHGVTQVMRGSDLLDSAARQILLYRALGLEASIPCYTHTALVRGPDGKRLAKRHGDTRLAEYRRRGVPPERLIGLFASWADPERFGRREAITAAGFLAIWGGDGRCKLPIADITFTPEDERWLLDA